jgi:hypothetical protein
MPNDVATGGSDRDESVANTKTRPIRANRRSRKRRYPCSTIRRTGRLLAPSTPVSSSTLPARPPQPSWRMRLRMWRTQLAAAVALDSEEP